MDQKTDSLEDWYADMAKKHGKTQADAMRSRLTVIKSTRYYNAKAFLCVARAVSHD